MTPDVSHLRLSMAIALLAGCYDPPQPQCGFRCGPASECPSGYVCGSDNHCRTEGTPESVVCATPDAAPFPDVGDPAPVIAEVMPAANATGVAVDVVIAVRFSEPVTNVSPTTFTLSSGAPVQGVVAFDAVTRIATFDPNDQLAANATFTINLSSGIVDSASQPIVPFSAVFTTGADAVSPKIRALSPSMNATGVAVASNIVVTFDEPVMNASAVSFQVEGGSVVGTVTSSNGGRTITFDPTMDLPAATTIDVSLTNAITDAAGNALAPFSYSFTTM